MYIHTAYLSANKNVGNIYSSSTVGKFFLEGTTLYIYNNRLVGGGTMVYDSYTSSYYTMASINIIINGTTRMH